MSDQDTKKKIVEASTYLFGVKGYDGTSTREIAQRAGVNIASLNYHFKSKQGLLKEVTASIIEEFKTKIVELAATSTGASDFAVRLFEMVTEDNIKFLNHFKLFLNSGHCDAEMDTSPLGYEQLGSFLKKELKPSVPDKEILWGSSIILTYIMHSAVMSASQIGQQHIDKFLPNKKASIPVYTRQIVETIIRDLNSRY